MKLDQQALASTGCHDIKPLLNLEILGWLKYLRTGVTLLYHSEIYFIKHSLLRPNNILLFIALLCINSTVLVFMREL